MHARRWGRVEGKLLSNMDTSSNFSQTAITRKQNAHFGSAQCPCTTFSGNLLCVTTCKKRKIKTNHLISGQQNLKPYLLLTRYTLNLISLSCDMRTCRYGITWITWSSPSFFPAPGADKLSKAIIPPVTRGIRNTHPYDPYRVAEAGLPSDNEKNPCTCLKSNP